MRNAIGKYIFRRNGWSTSNLIKFASGISTSTTFSTGLLVTNTNATKIYAVNQTTGAYVSDALAINNLNLDTSSAIGVMLDFYYDTPIEVYRIATSSTVSRYYSFDFTKFLTLNYCYCINQRINLFDFSGNASLTFIQTQNGAMVNAPFIFDTVMPLTTFNSLNSGSVIYPDWSFTPNLDRLYIYRTYGSLGDISSLINLTYLFSFSASLPNQSLSGMTKLVDLSLRATGTSDLLDMHNMSPTIETFRLEDVTLSHSGSTTLDFSNMPLLNNVMFRASNSKITPSEITSNLTYFNTTKTNYGGTALGEIYKKIDELGATNGTILYAQSYGYDITYQTYVDSLITKGWSVTGA